MKKRKQGIEIDLINGTGVFNVEEKFFLLLFNDEVQQNNIAGIFSSFELANEKRKTINKYRKNNKMSRIVEWDIRELTLDAEVF